MRYEDVLTKLVVAKRAASFVARIALFGELGEACLVDAHIDAEAF